jgi:hypothetical protein
VADPLSLPERLREKAKTNIDYGWSTNSNDLLLEAASSLVEKEERLRVAEAVVAAAEKLLPEAQAMDAQIEQEWGGGKSGWESPEITALVMAIDAYLQSLPKEET